MNPERILSYASTSSSSRRFSNASDWGIEASTQTPTLSHQSFFSALGPPLTSRNSRCRDSSTPASPHNTLPKPEPRSIDRGQLVRFTRKYLSLPSTSSKFKEDVKYQIILSCLLEDSMTLSKNDQSLTALKRRFTSLHLPLKTYTSTVFPDRAQLQLLGSKYKLQESLQMSRPALIFPILKFVYFLLKQSRFPQGHILLISKPTQWKVYKILLMVATKFIQYQKLIQYVRSLQVVSLLLNFLASNYQFNRRLILSVIALKEHEIYNFLPSTSNTDCEIKRDSASFVLNALQVAILSATFGVSRILDLVDGNLLEQYCSVNNLSMQTLLLSVIAPQESPLQVATRRLQQFHHIRKLLLCTILSFCDESLPCRTFFVESIAIHLGIPEPARYSSDFCNSIVKMEILHSVLSSANRTILVCTQHLADNDSLSKMTKASIYDQDVLPLYSAKAEKADSLAALVSKLECLTANVTQFAKVYSRDDQSLVSHKQGDKLRVFERFGYDLQLINNLHRQMQREIMENHSHTLVEPHIDVGLKSFRNASIQNRNSSPRSSWSLPSVRGSVSEPEGSPDRPRKYLSGLLIEVVKVVDQNNPCSAIAKGLPITSCDAIESTAEIDALDASFLSKQDLALKLEASLARIYALQTENQLLRAKSPRNMAETSGELVSRGAAGRISGGTIGTNDNDGQPMESSSEGPTEGPCDQNSLDCKNQTALQAFLLDLESKLQA